MSEQNVIERWAQDEYKEGVSASAAARQLCRSLGASDVAPTLKRILEVMLGEANRRSFDRSMILKDFEHADAEAAAAARRESFKRINGVSADT